MIKPLIFAACLALAGCVTPECKIFSPIRGSKADSPGTVAQVDIHNAKGVGACGWRP